MKQLSYSLKHYNMCRHHNQDSINYILYEVHADIRICRKNGYMSFMRFMLFTICSFLLFVALFIYFKPFLVPFKAFINFI